MSFHDFQRGAGTELLRLLPPVSRARDFHLYLEGGRRLTDLWQLGGRAILGHKPAKVLGELKNAAERGLFAALPHPAENRLLKALARLFPCQHEEPQFGFRLYSGRASLEAVLEKAGFPPENIKDPAMRFTPPETREAGLSLWRPFLEDPLPSLFVPVLPWAFSPEVLVFEKALENHFPPGDLLSPLVLVTAARAIHDLIAAGKDRGRPAYPRIRKTLARTDKWRRRGIYLRRCFGQDSEEDWPRLWKAFLEKGFLLPPVPWEPLILPGALSPGEEAKLATLLEE